VVYNNEIRDDGNRVQKEQCPYITMRGIRERTKG
jgi:hypothetical protein